MAKRFFADLTVVLAAMALVIVYTLGLLAGSSIESILIKSTIAFASVGFVGYLLVSLIEDRVEKRKQPPAETARGERLPEDGDGQA
ncbi:MAG: hypothetical protein HY677_04130 [Chloroflexi bacterium]|nr:hypothetical protein [Chloroflexota bacterium]